MATERMTINPGTGFDPTNAKHLSMVLTRLAEKENGGGWQMESYNPDTRLLSLTRQSVVTQVSKSETTADNYDVGLPAGTKPSDGDKISALLESNPSHLGYKMTAFDPFVGAATLSKLSLDAQRCRGAVAVALSVKPWDVQVAERSDGGFVLGLPRTYVPSKHDAKLTEVAETFVGRPGWYVVVDARTLTATIIPSEPPTFPAMAPYPLASLAKASLMSTPFGIKLADNGDAPGETASVDWVASSFLMLAGTPGSGKSVTLNALIAGHLAAGGELAICDEPSKSIDFIKFRDFVRPGGWGCKDSASAIATLGLVYAEGQRRAVFLEKHGAVNWLDLPDAIRFKPILIVVDELSALLVADPLPKGIPKDHPLYLEAAAQNLMAATLASQITKIISQQRFVGIRMILSTQVTNNNTGVGPSLKAKLGHKVLQGSNPSRSARAQAFNDETAVPSVPANVRADAKVAKGSGVGELEGSTPFVYKTFFASTTAYREALEKLNIPMTDRPEPTSAEIARYAPIVDDGLGDPPSRMPPETGGFGRDEKRAARTDGLSGAAAAGHDLRMAAAAA